MDDSSSSDGEGPFTAPTVASILGIKGSLRLRPHGSSQKAHVILRRVELSDDSDDDNDSKPLVYFSLFAQKRIEVKPGKEILLAVASPDFKDRAVIFEGDPLGENEAGSEDDNVVLQAEETNTAHAIPPKMRRTWTKRTEEVSLSQPLQPSISPTYASTATQTTPVSISAAVQTLPLPSVSQSSVSVQVDPPICTSIATQTAPSLHASSSSQTVEPEVTSASTGKGFILPKALSRFASRALQEKLEDIKLKDVDAMSERSLSPMELDSPSSTPAQSPSLRPSNEPEHSSIKEPPLLQLHKSSKASALQTKIPGKPFAGLSSLPPVEALRTPRLQSLGTISTSTTPLPIATPQTKPVPSVPASLASLRQPPNQTKLSGNGVVQGKIATDTKPSPKRPISNPFVSAGFTNPSEVLNSPTQNIQQPKPMKSITPPILLPSSRDSVQQPKLMAQVVSTPTPKLKPVVPNPFVSAGFVTEFGGVSSFGHKEPAKEPTVVIKKELESASSPRSSSEGSSCNSTPRSISRLPTLEGMSHGLPRDDRSEKKEVVGSRDDSGRRPFHIQKPPPSAPAALRSLQPQPALQSSSLPENSSNAVASSSKLLGPPSISLTIPSASVNGTHKEMSPTSPPGLIYKNAPPMHPLPEKPVRNMHLPAVRRAPRDDMYIPRSSSPPPAPRSLAVIYSGPITNPLNIRPSANSSLPKKPATNRTDPMTPNGASAKKSKPVVVGSGWPYTKHTSATHANSPSSSSLNVPSEAGPGTKDAPGSSSQQTTSLPPRPPPPTSCPPPTLAPAPVQKHSLPLKPTTSIATNESPPSPDTPPGLSHIATYHSPSPPPSSTASSSGEPSKWHPVNNIVDAVVLKLASTNGSAPNASPVMPSRVPTNGHSSTASTPPTPRLPTTVPKQESNSPKPLTVTVAVLPVATSKTEVPGSSKTTAATPSNASSTPASSVTTVVSMNPPPATNGAGPAILPSLPLKAADPVSNPTPNPTRGTKRVASPEPQRTEPVRPRKRLHKWATFDNIGRKRLQGDGKLSIREIAFNSDGSQFAVTCHDRTVRIWNSKHRAETARLAHNAPIISAVWMDGSTGIVSLGEDGIVSKWTRTGMDWQWAKILDTGPEHKIGEESICLAYMRDRIAVAFPRFGVKVWMWVKGTWQPQRAILRQNVSSLKFVDDGEALLGGTTDGVLWYCQIPNGTLRAYTFFKSKVHSIDVNATSTHALVAQVGGRSHLVGIRQNDNKGKIEQVYATKDTESQQKGIHEFGAIFANKGQVVLFGSVDGCVLVWDRTKGDLLYGLDHGDAEDKIHTVTAFDRGANALDGYLITGTEQGYLYWWSQPPTTSSNQQ